MKKYVISRKEYEGPVFFEARKIQAAMEKLRKGKKKSTPIVLDSSEIEELKAIAVKRGMPYQSLMKMLIIDGLKKIKRV